MMKKIAALLLIIGVAISMAGCYAFNNYETKNYPQKETVETIVYAQVNENNNLFPKLVELNADLQMMVAQMNADTTATTKITAAAIRELQNGITNLNPTENIFTIDLTLSGVPDSVATLDTKTFQIFSTQTIYNPLAALLPNLNTRSQDRFTFYFSSRSFTSKPLERRFSETSADRMVVDEGAYVYYWSNPNPIVLQNVYPNRVTYYLLIIAGAIIVGGIVYFIARYSYCKKRQNSL